MWLYVMGVVSRTTYDTECSDTFYLLLNIILIGFIAFIKKLLACIP